MRYRNRNYLKWIIESLDINEKRIVSFGFCLLYRCIIGVFKENGKRKEYVRLRYFYLKDFKWGKDNGIKGILYIVSK